MGGMARRIGRVVPVVGAALLLVSCQFQLGGPGNVFGNDLPAGCISTTSTVSPCPNPNLQPYVWAAIQGPFSRHQDGDPYATMCSGDTETRSTCDPGYPAQYGSAGAAFQNSGYNGNGYSWAVDVPSADVGQPVTVEIYDPSVSNTGAPLYESSGDPTLDFHTSFGLFQTTGDANNLSEDPSLSMAGHCDAGPGSNVFGYGTGAGTYFEQWYKLCTFTPTTAGIYPLQVKTSDIPGIADAGTGWNIYAVKAVARGGTGTQPNVYALDKLSIYTVPPGGQANVYLANVTSAYAGDTVNIDMFDPGDGGSSLSQYTLQILGPPSGLGRVPFGGSPMTCSYDSYPGAMIGPPADTTATPCTVVTKTAGASSGIYNGGWLRISVPVPADYTCSTDCWWWVHYDLGATSSAPNDRTTWQVGFVIPPKS